MANIVSGGNDGFKINANISGPSGNYGTTIGARSGNNRNVNGVNSSNKVTEEYDFGISTFSNSNSISGIGFGEKVIDRNEFGGSFYNFNNNMADSSSNNSSAIYKNFGTYFPSGNNATSDIGDSVDNLDLISGVSVQVESSGANMTVEYVQLIIEVAENKISELTLNLEKLNKDYDSFIKASSDEYAGLFYDGTRYLSPLEYKNLYYSTKYSYASGGNNSLANSGGYGAMQQNNFLHKSSTSNMITPEDYEKKFNEHFKQKNGYSYTDYLSQVEKINTEMAEVKVSKYSLDQYKKEIPYFEKEETESYKKFKENFDVNTSFPVEQVEQTVGAYHTQRVQKVSVNPAGTAFSFLTENEKIMYSYLYYNDGKSAANSYLKAIEDRLNQRKGQKEAEEYLKTITDDKGNIKRDIITGTITAGKGFFDGIETFGEGLENIFATDGMISDNQYAQTFILRALGEEGILDDVYQMGSTFGNMAPSMLLSATTNILLPGSGSVVGSAMMGLSSGGNAKMDALVSGNDMLSATIYGLLSGLSETSLGLLLGNIPGLNENAKLSMRGLIGEGTEEFIQSFVDAGLRSSILGEDIDIGQLFGEGGKSFIYGVITSGIMNGGKLACDIAFNKTTVHISSINDLINFVSAFNSDEMTIKKVNGKDVIVFNNDADVSSETINNIKQIFPEAEIRQVVSKDGATIDINSLNSNKQNTETYNTTLINAKKELDNISNKVTNYLQYISSYIASNIRKFFYRDTSSFNGLNNEILQNGLYHFTSDADSIISSGFIKATAENLTGISGYFGASYGNPKTFFFNGIPSVGAYATNLDSIPLKTTAVKINPTTQLVSDSKLKVRYADDQAITYDGRFDLNGYNAEKSYFVLGFENGQLAYKQVSETEYNHYDKTDIGRLLSEYASKENFLTNIKSNFLKEITFKNAGKRTTYTDSTSSTRIIHPTHGFQLNKDDFSGFFKAKVDSGFFTQEQIVGMLNNFNGKGYISESSGNYYSSLFDNSDYDVYVKTVHSTDLESIMEEGIRCLGNLTSGMGTVPTDISDVKLGNTITKVEGTYDLLTNLKNANGFSQGGNPIDGTLVLKIPKGADISSILYYNEKSGCYCIKNEYIDCFSAVNSDGVVSEPIFNDNATIIENDIVDNKNTLFESIVSKIGLDKANISLMHMVENLINLNDLKSKVERIINEGDFEILNSQLTFDERLYLILDYYYTEAILSFDGIYDPRILSYKIISNENFISNIFSDSEIMYMFKNINKFDQLFNSDFVLILIDRVINFSDQNKSLLMENILQLESYLTKERFILSLDDINIVKALSNLKDTDFEFYEYMLSKMNESDVIRVLSSDKSLQISLNIFNNIIMKMNDDNKILLLDIIDDVYYKVRIFDSLNFENKLKIYENNDFNLPVNDYLKKVDITFLKEYERRLSEQNKINIKQEVVAVVSKLKQSGITDELSIARVVYLCLGKELSYTHNYTDVTNVEYASKINQDSLLNVDRNVICYTWSALYKECLIAAGINPEHIRIINHYNNAHHFVCLNLNGSYYIADATYNYTEENIDLVNIKIGKQTEGFFESNYGKYIFDGFDTSFNHAFHNKIENEKIFEVDSVCEIKTNDRFYAKVSDLKAILEEQKISNSKLLSNNQLNSLIFHILNSQKMNANDLYALYYYIKAEYNNVRFATYGNGYSNTKYVVLSFLQDDGTIKYYIKREFEKFYEIEDISCFISKLRLELQHGNIY